MRLGIVIPCYNEEEVLEHSITRLSTLLAGLIAKGRVDAASRIWIVDDGSSDATWTITEALARNNSQVAGIKLSCNRGQQNALLAGLLTAEGDALITMDSDMQDDMGVIENMIEEFRLGADVVYGVRKARASDTLFKRKTAEAFYRLMSLMGARTVYNHSEYRMLSRRAIESLREYKEVNLFLRGIVPLIGYKSSLVYYDRTERFAGESKYSLAKMVALAVDAITSFSVVPLRVITFTGFFIFLASMAITMWVLWVRIFTPNALPGWASTVLPMYFLGGIQILCIGVIGEYLGKIYAEVKARPRFTIEKII